MSKNWIKVIVLIGLLIAVKLYIDRNSEILVDNLEDAVLSQNERTKRLLSEPIAKESQTYYYSKSKDASSATEDSNQEQVANQNPRIPPQCKDVWHYMMYTDFNQIMENLPRSASNEEMQCESRVELVDRNLKEFLGRECLAVLQESNDTTLPEVNECIGKLVAYRASIIHHYTLDIPLEELSPQVLSHKLMMFFSALDFNKLDWAHSVADELIKKEPNLYMARKVKVVLNFYEQTINKEASTEALDASLEEARSFNEDDPELAEASFIIPQMKNNKEALTNVINEYLNSDNPPAIAYYYKSALEWSYNKDRSAALVSIKKALEINPKDPRFKVALEGLESANIDSNEKFFSAKMSTNFVQF